MTISDYSDGYDLVEKIAINNNAIIVGKFGSIKYPGISDLDMFICFEDNDYKRGCENVEKYIRSDLRLNYLFTHEPMFVNRSMLDKVKYLHTLTNLTITYNPSSIEIGTVISEEYKQYLNKIWSYAFYRIIDDIELIGVMYYDIRFLLLFTKNLHVSIDNFQRLYHLNYTGVLTRSDMLRQKVQLEPENARPLVLSEYNTTVEEIKSIILTLDSRVKFKVRFKIPLYKRIYLESSDKTKQTVENNNLIYYVNAFYFGLILDILLQVSKNSRIYYKSVKFNYIWHKKIGGDINKHVWIIPEKCISKSFYFNQLVVVKHYMKMLFKNIHEKINK